MKLSLPLKLAFGVYVMLPFASTLTLPLAGPLMTTGVSTSPSTSVSLFSTGMLTDVSSFVDAESFPACGASLTEVIVTCTDAVALPPCASLMA
ncbi:MAG: hypothetical protein DMF88_15435 [Acidobacteria bacterium]|nr:MAG: hypothetical protein DMF88_15435 [Acidobacteriota bacterium]